MFHFFRKKKIVLDCFTHVHELAELFPIVHASEKMPSWWKNIPSTVSHFGVNRGTMRTCPGVSTLFTNGIILQNWTDFQVSTDNNQLVVQPEKRCESHNPLQWGNNELLKGYYHVKLISPWKIKEKTGINFLFTNVFWHDPTFKPVVVNGVVDYKYQHTTSVNMLIPRTVYPKDFLIPAGKELAHIIPLTEDITIEIKNHLIDTKEYDALGGYQFTFNGQYFKRKKLLKSLGL